MNPTDAATPPRSAAPDGEGVAASDHQLARLVRDESARIVGILTAATGNLDVAEEATAEAIEEALRAWRQHGVPTRPGAGSSRRHGTTLWTGYAGRRDTARSWRPSAR